MALVHRTAPTDALQIVEHEVSRRLRRRSTNALGGAQAASVCKVGLPLFNCDVKSLQEVGDPSPTLIGWRYLLVKGDEILELADVSDDETPRFLGLTRGGTLVPNFARTLETAEAAIENLAGDWELRILQIPALYVVSLWAHSEREAVNDRFFPIESAPAHGHPRNVGSTVFWREVREAARRGGSSALEPA